MIDVKSKTDIDPNTTTDFWQARINAKGSSDIEVLEVRIAPGGTFGWHSHPGPSLVIVKTGAATFLPGRRPDLHAAHVVLAGSGSVDSGGDAHVVRSEGSVELVRSLAIRAGATRRIDEPSPGNCPF